MVTLEEVRALITQHYTHSQTTAEAAAEHAKAVKDLKIQVRYLSFNLVTIVT